MAHNAFTMDVLDLETAHPHPIQEVYKPIALRVALIQFIMFYVVLLSPPKSGFFEMVHSKKQISGLSHLRRPMLHGQALAVSE